MDNTEFLTKAQAIVDETSKAHFSTTVLTPIYQENKEDGTSVLYCLAADTPNPFYRIFLADKDGVVTEVNNAKDASTYIDHYALDIRPNQLFKEVSPHTYESTEYEIVLENRIENAPTELKLRSSNGRDITMREIYNYYDVNRKIFLVSAITLSNGINFLFTVTPDSKHLRLVLRVTDAIREISDMIKELWTNRVPLPRYNTIEATTRALHTPATLRGNDANGNARTYISQYRYDDPVSRLKFGFFREAASSQRELVVIVDNYGPQVRTITPQHWTDEQRAIFDRVRRLRSENQAEFNKNVVPYNTDNLDFRYADFKAGVLTGTQPAEATVAETVAPSEPAQTSESTTEEKSE